MASTYARGDRFARFSTWTSSTYPRTYIPPRFGFRFPVSSTLFCSLSPLLFFSPPLLLQPHAVTRVTKSCLLVQVLGGLLQAPVALLVGAAGTEAGAEEGGPGPPLEEEDGEDDAEAEAEGGFYDEVREAAVPLRIWKIKNAHMREHRSAPQITPDIMWVRYTLLNEGSNLLV